MHLKYLIEQTKSDMKKKTFVSDFFPKIRFEATLSLEITVTDLFFPKIKFGKEEKKRRNNSC